LRGAVRGKAKTRQELQQGYEKYVGSHKNYGGFINDSTMNFMCFIRRI